ncbi:MAG: 30S ribosomal protein S1, partial [Terrabacter sp.]
GSATSYSSATGDVADSGDADRADRGQRNAPAPAEGTLASDEALAALREKLTGN